MPSTRCAFLGRQQQHSARAVGLAEFEEGLLDELAVARFGGVADHQRALQGVEADHGLQVRVARVDRGQRERHAALDERAGDLPGDAELARDERVLDRPAPLAVVGCAVVADVLGDLQVVGRLGPVAADGGERGGGAGHVVLAHEAHRQLHAAVLVPACLDPLDEGLVVRIARCAGLLQRALEIAQPQPGVAAALRQPVGQALVGDHRELLPARERGERRGVVAAVVLELCELERERRAFEVLQLRAQQRDRFGVALVQRQQPRALLDCAA